MPAKKLPIPNRMRAYCIDCNYLGPWRTEKDKIKIDGLKHRKKPGCEKHAIDYIITVHGALIR